MDSQPLRAIYKSRLLRGVGGFGLGWLVLQLKMTGLPNGGRNPEQWLAGLWMRLAVSIILIRPPGKISFSYFKGLRIIFCNMFLLPAESCGNQPISTNGRFKQISPADPLALIEVTIKLFSHML